MIDRIGGKPASIAPHRTQLLGLMRGRELKLQLFDKLHGQKLNTMETVAEAETAYAKLRDLRLLVPADFPQVLKFINEVPQSRWHHDYGGSEGCEWVETSFGSANSLEADYEAQCARFDRLEEEADAPIKARRDALCVVIKRHILDHPETTISFILKNLAIDPTIHSAAIEKINNRPNELDPISDFPFIVNSIRDPKLRAFVAASPSSSKAVLIELLADKDRTIVIATRNNIKSRGLMTPDEMLEAAQRNNDHELIAETISSWPNDQPFLPDRVRPVYPLSLSGYMMEDIAEIGLNDGIDKALCLIARMLSLRNQRFLERNERFLGRDLVLLTQQFSLFGTDHNDKVPTPQHILGNMRARAALSAIGQNKDPDYHSLAYLYYALRFGEATLGSESNAETLIKSLRILKGMNIHTPKVLVLGFSSIYALENLGALLYLVGFKNAEIIAIDLSEKPIFQAKQHFGQRVFGYKVRYEQANALDLPFEDETFDLVCTHLFMTHIEDAEKPKVYSESRRVLRPGMIFADEEIAVPPNIDREKYKWFYTVLANNYPDHLETERVRQLMLKFGGWSTFFPYVGKPSLEKDIAQAGFGGGIISTDTRTLYHEGDTAIKADCCQIIARKS